MKVSGIFLVALLLLILPGCIKKPSLPPAEETQYVNTELASGLPEDHFAIHGYFFAAVTTETSSFGSNMSLARLHAAFSDPARDLLSGFDHHQMFENERLGNISVGNVSFNGMHLSTFQSGGEVIYSGSSNFSNFNYSAKWNSQGNGPFLPVSVALPRGLPKLSQGAIPTSGSRNNLSFDVSKFTTNYDSISITIGSGMEIRKTIAYPEHIITFTKSELDEVIPSQMYTNLGIRAYNYAHKTINSKRYVFEGCDRHFRSFILNP